MATQKQKCPVCDDRPATVAICEPCFDYLKNGDPDAKTVREILQSYLAAHGYDGLYNPDVGGDPCGCGIGELFPCESCPRDCMPGYRGKNDDGENIFCGEKHD